jgi:predicted molibdopterin-dependent oxidoreductase YjgC
MKEPKPPARIGHPGQRGPRLTIFLDGQPCAAYPGETIAGALVAAGRLHFRKTSDRRDWRGYYCGMGVCWECLVVVDGRPNVRACVTFARDGMRIETQDGYGHRGAQ